MHGPLMRMHRAQFNYESVNLSSARLVSVRWMSRCVRNGITMAAPLVVVYPAWERCCITNRLINIYIVTMIGRVVFVRGIGENVSKKSLMKSS